jgi:hypothetical protein
VMDRDPVVQLGGWLFFNPEVVGSIPSRLTFFWLGSRLMAWNHQKASRKSPKRDPRGIEPATTGPPVTHTTTGPWEHYLRN